MKLNISQSNPLMQSIIRNPLFTISLIDPDLRYVWINNPFLQLSLNSIIGKRDDELGIKGGTKRLMKFKRNIIATRKEYHDQFGFKVKSEMVYYEIFGQPVFNERGEISGLTTIAIDITRQKKTETGLRQREGQHKILCNLVSDYIYSAKVYFNGKFETEWITGALERITGYSLREIQKLERGFGSIVNTEDLEEFVNIDIPKLINKQSVFAEYRINHKNGNTRWVRDSHKSFQINNKGKYVRILGTVKDITQYKESEENILKTRNLFEATFNSLNEAVFIIDPKTRVIISANKSVEKIFGYSNDEVIGKNTELLHVDRKHYENFGGELFPKLNSEGIFQEDNLFMKRKDGKVFPTMHTVSEVINKEGLRTYVVSVVQDISFRKTAEEKIRQSENQLRALASQLMEGHEQERKFIARELHDEVGQSLSAMRFNLSLLEKELSSNINTELKFRIAETNKILETVLSQVHAMSMNLHPSILDDLGLLPAIKEYINQFMKRTKLNVVFQSNLDKRQNPEIEINLYRVLQETLTNITKHSQAKNVRIYLNLEQSTVKLIIQDDGKGFNRKDVLNIKKTNRGMGLRSMQERITYLGGDMDIISSPGKGTKIDINIPMAG